MNDLNYYCGMVSDQEAYDARETMIEATTPEPTPSVFAENVWVSGQPTS